MHIIATGHPLHWLVRQVAIPSSFPSYKLNRSGQIFTVGCNDLFIPIETVLLQTLAITRAIILIVNIDEAVSFCHFSGRGGHEVNAAPHSVAHQIHTIQRNGISHRGSVWSGPHLFSGAPLQTGYGQPV